MDCRDRLKAPPRRARARRVRNSGNTSTARDNRNGTPARCIRRGWIVGSLRRPTTVTRCSSSTSMRNEEE
jgi:hypothetical protein